MRIIFILLFCLILISCKESETKSLTVSDNNLVNEIPSCSSHTVTTNWTTTTNEIGGTFIQMDENCLGYGFQCDTYFEYSFEEIDGQIIMILDSVQGLQQSSCMILGRYLCYLNPEGINGSDLYYQCEME